MIEKKNVYARSEKKIPINLKYLPFKSTFDY